MDFVHVNTYTNYIEAHIASAMLQEEGINCHLEDENMATMLSYASGMRLMVVESQVERSLEILKQAELEYLKTIACPHCKEKSLEIKLVVEDADAVLKKFIFGRIISLMARLFSAEGNKITVKHYSCTSCGKEYASLPPNEFS
ncbi:MAG: hypothetical protein C4308_14390 [Chitinophagaceae bacterium]